MDFLLHKHENRQLRYTIYINLSKKTINSIEQTINLLRKILNLSDYTIFFNKIYKYLLIRIWRFFFKMKDHFNHFFIEVIYIFYQFR